MIEVSQPARAHDHVNGQTKVGNRLVKWRNWLNYTAYGVSAVRKCTFDTMHI